MANPEYAECLGALVLRGGTRTNKILTYNIHCTDTPGLQNLRHNDGVWPAVSKQLRVYNIENFY